jgi:hypothetical protein
MRVPYWLMIVPSDEVRRTFSGLLVQAAERQVLIDVGDLTWLQRSYRNHSAECRTARYVSVSPPSTTTT